MRVRGFIPFIPLLFFILWESGAIHQYFRLITPMYIVSLISALSLLIYFSMGRLGDAKVAAIPIFFMALFLRNPVPYIFILLILLYYYYGNGVLLKSIFILLPLTAVEGLGIALDLKFVLLITFLFFFISISNEFEDSRRIKPKPLTILLFYIPLIFLLLSLSTFEPLAHEKNGIVAYDGYHHKVESALFENDSLTHSTLRYLRSNGYNTKMLSAPISPDSLRDLSILIIETPEKEFTSQEIGYILDFVDDGGGLFVLGDHTNLMDCYLNLNPILEKFGLHLNFDYSMLWEPHFSSLTNFDSTEETAGGTLMVNRSDALIFYALKYTTWADKGDWNAQNRAYLGNVIPDKDEDYGFLPICASVNFGKGRIIAIANSDSISGPNLIYNYGFVGKVISYLNYENSFFKSIWFRLILVLLLLVGIFAARLSVITPMILSLSIVLVIVQAQALVPVTSAPENMIALDVGHANLEGYGDPHQYKNVFFAIFSQHYGFNPMLVKKVQKELSDCKAYVTMGPTSQFSEKEVDLLANFVTGGGTLIVFDGYHSEIGADPSNEAANSLLGAFDMSLNGTLLGEIMYFNYTTWDYHLPYMKETKIYAKPLNSSLTQGINGDINLYSAVEILGGDPVALYNSTVVIASKKVGRGQVIVIGDHTIFRNFVRYEPVFRYPDPGFKKLIENILISLGGKEQNGI
ncbi:MAG TPA: hypothetical protein VMY43_04900 [Methanothrix sp.]|nr:hypothetical protein [Methanothrix sp.]